MPFRTKTQDDPDVFRERKRAIDEERVIEVDVSNLSKLERKRKRKLYHDILKFYKIYYREVIS